MVPEKIGDIKSADVVKDEQGRQYHIGLAPGELAENIILVGNPERPNKAKEFFTEITKETQAREYKTITGKINDLEVSVMSTGIGPDNVEIALVEIMQITRAPTLIRAGSCGALQEFIDVGDLVISTGAVRLENTSIYFVPEGYPAVAHYEVVLALSEAANICGGMYHLGLTASASGFYGAQGRDIPGLPVRFPTLPEDLAKIKVYNFEMETSTLFNLSQVLGLRAGSVCAVYINRPRGTFIPNDLLSNAEKKCLETAIKAFEILQKMDQIKRNQNKSYWIPSLSLPED
ncbi:MAG: nucleoside phosphorylase [Candidatus Heimdallarchaeota archaeon]|nr:MAG: nucleoside phosphorylase [Candidatus Heimdallarchaeota archaeon]